MRIQNGDVILDDSITKMTKLQKSVAQIRQGLKRSVSKADMRLTSLAAEKVLEGLDADHSDMPTNSLHPHHQANVQHVPHIVTSPKYVKKQNSNGQIGSPGKQLFPASDEESPVKSPKSGLSNMLKSPFNKSAARIQPAETKAPTSPMKNIMSPTRSSQAKRASKEMVDVVRYHP